MSSAQGEVIRHGSPAGAWLPDTDEDRAAIGAQVERVLAHALFNRSKRFQGVLRYTVERVLAGRCNELKEQTLGEVVFGRRPDYDTAVDHIVRSTVSEMRKRLAQYYSIPEHASEIWISIPPGSYVPVFGRTVPAPIVAATGAQSTRRPLRLYLLLVGLAAICIFGIVWYAHRGPRTALDRFWVPVLDSPGEAVVCAGPLASGSGREIRFAAGLSNITTLLRAGGRHSTIMAATSASLKDFMAGPLILIGAYNNPWTLRFTGPLRFHFVGDRSTRSAFIEDRENPSRRDWSVQFGLPESAATRDYGIVARFKEPATGRMTVVLAGQLNFGVGSAIAMVTTNEFMEYFNRQAPKGWERKNFELVFATDMIDGKRGSPRIVATEFW